MKTLKELFDEHGSVWLAHKDTPNKKEFKPLAYSESHSDYVIGDQFEIDHFCTVYPKQRSNLVLYQEPKKKVVRYLFAVRTTQDGWTVRPYFITDNEAVRIYSKTDIVDFKRLDYTATEFEE